MVRLTVKVKGGNRSTVSSGAMEESTARQYIDVILKTRKDKESLTIEIKAVDAGTQNIQTLKTFKSTKNILPWAFCSLMIGENAHYYKTKNIRQYLF